MSEFDPLPPCDPLHDSGLSQLKEHIKNTMIPLLIKIFQIRLEVQQASAPTSRLHSQNPSLKTSLPELIEQLQRLDEDLKLVQVWSQSCRAQVEKVMSEAKQVPTGDPIYPPREKTFTPPSKTSPLQALLKKISLLYRSLSS